MSNIYEIAVKIGIVGNAQAALALLATEVVGLDGKVSGLIGKFNQLGVSAKLALGGGVALAAGVGMATMLDNLAEKGNNWLRVLQRMQQAGVSGQNVLGAASAATSASAAFPNMSKVETINLANDFRMIFGSQEEANHWLPIGTQAASMLKWLAANGSFSGDSEALLKEVFSAAKSAEIAGIIDPSSAQGYIQKLIAAKVAFGNQVDISQILGAQRMAGPAYFNLDDTSRAMFAALTQEYGSAAGAGLRQSFQKIVSGATLSNYAVESFSDLGLINPGAAHWNSKIGKYDKVSPGGIVGRDLFATDPGAWVEKFLRPALDAYVTKMGITDPQQRQIEETGMIQRMFSGRNAAQYIGALFFQNSKFQKDARLYEEALAGMDPSKIKGTLDYQNQAVAAQFNNLLTDLGTSLTPLITSMKADLVPMLQALDKLAQDKPLMEAIGKVAVALSGALIVGGITALGAAIAAMATPVVLAAAGVTALIGVIWAFRDAVKSAFDYLASFLPTGGHLSYGTGTGSATAPALVNPFKGRNGTLPSIKDAGSYLDNLDAGNGMFPAPPARGSNTNVFVYLDGKEVANRVVQRVVTGSTFTTGSAAFDGASAYGAR